MGEIFSEKKKYIYISEKQRGNKLILESTKDRRKKAMVKNTGGEINVQH